MHVVASVVDAERDRPSNAAGIGVAEQLAGSQDARWRKDRPGPGARQSGHGAVDGQMGDGGELRHGEQITASHAAPRQGTRREAQAMPCEAVTPGEDAECGRQGVGSAAEHAARSPRGAGGGHCVSDHDLPLRGGCLVQDEADVVGC